MCSARSSRQLGGVLCHRALLALTTRHRESITGDASTLADFATLATRWDLAQPDETIEAEDTLTMETA